MATVFFYLRAGPNGPGKTAATRIGSCGLRPEEFFLLFFGFWFLVFGFWFLVFGFWFLVFGFWFLVFGLARVARSMKPCRCSGLCFFGPFVPARSLPKPIASFG